MSLIRVSHIEKRYPLPREALFNRPRETTAVAGVSFTVVPGDILGVVGESGSGKSTLCRLLVGLEEPDSGTIEVAGFDLTNLRREDRLHFRREVQMVFQDPLSSLDPRMSIERALLEPLRSLKIDTDHRQRVGEVLDAVQMPAGSARKFPHEFSGGQRQRIAIARALAPRPRILVADEPVSALDLSVQAQILNLLLDLREDFGLTIVMVAHDMSVVHHLSDRVLVMKSGEVVERGVTSEVFRNPSHEYSKTLIAAIPTMKSGPS